MDAMEEGVIDLTSPGARETVSDEELARRLQREEYEFMNTHDFLVAQQLQAQLASEHRRALRNLSDMAEDQPSRPAVRVRAPRPQTRQQHALTAASTSSVSADGATSSEISPRVSTLRMAMGRLRDEPRSNALQTNSATDEAAHADMEVDAPEAAVQAEAPVQRVAPRKKLPRLQLPTMPTDFEESRQNGFRQHNLVHPLLPFGVFNPFLSRHQRVFPFASTFAHDDGSGNDYEALWELSERIGDVGRKGLNKGEINRLPTTKFSARSPTSSAEATRSSMEDIECRICLSNFNDKEVLRTLPCCHIFHVACIDQWIKLNAACPVCREDVRDHLHMMQSSSSSSNM